jgi:hypothetical protein
LIDDEASPSRRDTGAPAIATVLTTVAVGVGRPPAVMTIVARRAAADHGPACAAMAPPSLGEHGGFQQTPRTVSHRAAIGQEAAHGSRCASALLQRGVERIC